MRCYALKTSFFRLFTLSALLLLPAAVTPGCASEGKLAFPAGSGSSSTGLSSTSDAGPQGGIGSATPAVSESQAAATLGNIGPWRSRPEKDLETKCRAHDGILISKDGHWVCQIHAPIGDRRERDDEIVEVIENEREIVIIEPRRDLDFFDCDEQIIICHGDRNERSVRRGEAFEGEGCRDRKRGFLDDDWIEGSCQTHNEHCTDKDDCDDYNRCTDDCCDERSGVCTHTALNCSDGDPCTTDTCDRRKGCVHTPNICQCHVDADCNDLNVCTIDTCNLDTGRCVHTNVPDGPKSNGNPCVLNGFCTDGVFTSQPNTCNDDNICTNDFCFPNTPVGQNPCHNIPTVPSICDSGLECIIDTCTANTCHHTDTCEIGHCTASGCVQLPLCLGTYCGTTVDSCVDLLNQNGTNPPGAFCGTCGHVCTGDTPVCCNGVCQSSETCTLPTPCTGTDPTVECPNNDDMCTDLFTDPNNCGACGQVCTHNCCAGACTELTCEECDPNIGGETPSCADNQSCVDDSCPDAQPVCTASGICEVCVACMADSDCGICTCTVPGHSCIGKSTGDNCVGGGVCECPLPCDPGVGPAAPPTVATDCAIYPTGCCTNNTNYAGRAKEAASLRRAASNNGNNCCSDADCGPYTFGGHCSGATISTLSQNGTGASVGNCEARGTVGQPSSDCTNNAGGSIATSDAPNFCGCTAPSQCQTGDTFGPICFSNFCSCASSSDCTAMNGGQGTGPGPICNPLSGVCGCTQDSDCSLVNHPRTYGTACLTVAVNFQECGCTSDADCVGNLHGTHCNTGFHVCGP